LNIDLMLPSIPSTVTYATFENLLQSNW